MDLNKTKVIQVIPYFVYLFILIFIFQFRSQLDKSDIYITSDGAVKLYQTVQYKENGFFSLECIYPGKKLDSEFKHFPISYPWAIFQTREHKCVLEYPPFFYWLGSLMLKPLPLASLMYLPLLFYSINIFLFDFILRKIGLNSIFRVLLIFLGFISFPLLTAMDYTENPAFQTFYLLGFYLFWKLNQDEERNYRILFLTGIVFGLSFIMRLEILMTFSILCLFYFLFTRDFAKPFYVYIGFTIVGILFVLYNIKVSGHPLGFRYVSSIEFNDNAKADIGKRLMFLRASIWGNEVMVGIFKFQPLCWLMLLFPVWAWIKKSRLQMGNVFLSSGWISMLVIPFYITVYGGVGYFGLRYLEAPFFLILIGFAIYLSQNFFLKSTLQKWILIFLMIAIGYYNWLSTREGLKILRISSQENAVFQSFLKKSDRLVIHSSLYTSIWMGKSFFEKIHVALTGNEEVIEYLKQIPLNEKFILLLSPKDIYISADIPKKLHYRYQTQLNLDLLPLEITEDTTMNGIRLVLAKKK